MKTPSTELERVLIAGGGVAGLETALALHELAGDLTEVTLLTPDRDFHYRPLTVREPFALAPASRLPLAPIAGAARAILMRDELAWVDRERRIAHTAGGEALHYDALVLAVGARATPRWSHTTTIDAADMEEIHGIVQDVEAGYIRTLAFVAPGRMAWPLPLYELALLTAGRAYDMSMEIDITLVTPEDAPLAIFGSAVSDAIARLLERSGIHTLNSAYAEIHRPGEVLISPGDRRLQVDRVIALPELYGPGVRGLPLGEHGFVRVDPHGRVLEAEHV